ncbi:transcriptional co-activator [Gigaspora margarita]|uniref:Transcriptional co-activator n=1 Tax=Gigaspora margarita TaxID=4874 RepID=A0A8H4EL20_GIGMA|nr:transcriptional co-activator [Gigaspora margarita]
MPMSKAVNGTLPGPSNAQKGKAKMTQTNIPLPSLVNNVRRNGNSPQRPLPDHDERFDHVTYIGIEKTRIDTYQIKRQLTEFLGDNAHPYWDAFKKFIYCKIRRQDFERIVRPSLDREHLELHNMLLLGILNNCLCNDPPPPQNHPVTQQKKRGREDELHEQSDGLPDPKKRRIKELVMSLPREERERIKSLRKDLNGVITMPDPMATVLPVPRSEQLPLFDLNDQQNVIKPQLNPERVQTCREMKALPDSNTLYNRILEIARANGLQNISDDCASLLNYGLESHLKNIIGNVLQKTRAGNSLGINSSGMRNAEYRYRAATTSQEKRTITARDLAFSFEMSPHILVEPSFAREKLTSVVMNEDEDYDMEDMEDVEDDDDEDD